MMSSKGPSIPDVQNRRAIYVSSHHANLKTEHFLKSVSTFHDFVATFDLAAASWEWHLPPEESLGKLNEVKELLAFNRELLTEAEELMQKLAAALLLLSDHVTGLEAETSDSGNVVHLSRWRATHSSSQTKISETLDRVDSLGNMISQIGDRISLKTRQLISLVVA